MAVNLVHQFGRARSRELLEQSFAQFQADKAVVGLARQVHKAEEALEGYREAATCHLGDFMEYADAPPPDLRRSRRAPPGSAGRTAAARPPASLGRLRPGDVIQVPAGKFSGLAVVIDPGTAGDEPAALRRHRRPAGAAAGHRWTSRCRSSRSVGCGSPSPSTAATPGSGATSPRRCRSRADDFDAPAPAAHEAAGVASATPPTDREIGRLRADLKAHPCHQCPEREDHARWAERYFKLQRDTETLKRRVENRTNTVARTFDRVCDVLTALDYLEGDKVTERGSHLRRIYTDMDLVAAEAIRAGLFDDLAPSELAAVLSALVFEARRADDASLAEDARRPGRGRCWREVVRLWGQLDALERDHKLDFLREPDVGFAWAAWRWAEGDDLDDVLMVTGLSAGDFVRWMKQLLDLCGQVADAAGDSELRATARTTAKLLNAA